MSHTPGPWGAFTGRLKALGVTERFLQPEAAETEFGGIVAIIPSDTYPPDVANANLRLLAAAPDLLEALEDLHALVRGESARLLDSDVGGDERVALKVEAALAKARGAS